MKLSEIKPILTAAQRVQDAIRMTGLHGIGKTEIVREWAEENDYHLESLYLSNQEVGDIVGVPHNELINGIMIEKWSVPSWLQRMREASENGKHTVLFLDEFSRAPLDVRQAALQLVLDKRVHEHDLPTTNNLKTFIVAADNPDNGDYQVEALDPALLDRFCSIDVEVDVEGWLEYARNKNLNSIVRAFIADNPSKLHFTPDSSNDDIGATPRSWAKLSQYVDNFDKTPRESHYSIISGKVGKAISAQFINFLNNYTTMVSIEDIENLVKKLDNKNLNIDQIGLGVKELTKDSETIQITELTYSIVNKYINEKSNTIGSKVLLGMLYSLNIEILVSVFKKLASENNNNYQKLVKLDTDMNDKKLFIQAASAIVV